MRIIKGPLEYLLVNEKGSAHESLFMTTATPFEVNVAMLLLGFKECSGYFKKASPESLPQAVKNPKIATESNFEVVVEWKNEKGETVSNKAEEWVFNLAANAKLADGPFVYTGSFINDQGQLSAQANGNVISLYNEPGALAQNPRKNNDLDDVWDSRPALAVEGREVTLILRRAASVAAEEATLQDKPAEAPPKKSDSKKPQKPTTKSKP
jgi:hypothetical protein